LVPFSVFFMFAAGVFSQERPFTEAQRKALNMQYDKKHLLTGSGMVTDKSGKFVTIPADMDLAWMGDVDVAKTAPVIEFAPVKGMTPRYFPEDNVGYWSNFGDVTRAPNGRYYFGVGDHRGPQGNSYAVEYDPAKRDYRLILDLGKMLGWDKLGVGDGKLHGQMGAMQDGALWILTYWDPMPGLKDVDYEKWPGSHVIRYDTHGGKAEDLGIPLAKAGWPYYTLDSRRGIIFAVGSRGENLAYDVNKRKVIFAGMPPDGNIWWERAAMLDPMTGFFWGCTKSAPFNFVSYNPETNAFKKYVETTPNDLGRNAGKNSVIRGYSERRTKEGFLWVNSTNGTLYRFLPETRKTVTEGLLWADYTYVPRVSLSPDDRYLYYVANGKRTQYRYKPVVQYDTRTNRKKVIAFIADYYFDKYGYVLGSVHGSTLSKDGSDYIIVFNGSFLPRDKEWQDTPALMVVHIPGSERK
jgi:hypothetical protein